VHIQLAAPAGAPMAHSDTKEWTVEEFLEQAPAPDLPEIQSNVETFIKHQSRKITYIIYD